MLAEYKGQVFKAKINGNRVDVWKYVPVEGFQKVTTKRGITYYKKSISVEDVKEFFTVTFIAILKDRKFVINSLDGNNLDVLCNNREYAEANRFEKMERGVWISKQRIESFDGFQMIKSIRNSENETILNVNQKQIKDLWQKYVKEVDI